MSKPTSISLQMYNRLTRYLNYLKRLSCETTPTISATAIAEALGLNPVLVRKDLAAGTTGSGKPKIGYITPDLITELEDFLGYNNNSESVLVGVGNLGKALLSYQNFEKCGLKIIAAFDNNPDIIGKEIGGKKIIDSHKITNLCKRMSIRIGIIAVSDTHAQEICDNLVEGGVRAIWNFAPINLKAPENVVIRNEEMAASLAMLTKQLEESLAKFGA